MRNNWLHLTLASKRTPCPWCEALHDALPYAVVIVGLVVILISQWG